jgi:hypothetical protein
LTKCTKSSTHMQVALQPDTTCVSVPVVASTRRNDQSDPQNNNKSLRWQKTSFQLFPLPDTHYHSWRKQNMSL